MATTSRLRLLGLSLLLASPLALTAGELPTDATLLARADKIVAPMNLADATVRTRVRVRIARQYHDLSVLHADRDARLKAIPTTEDKATLAELRKKITADAEAAQDKLHAAFLADLAADLAPAQIEQVKDGLTYGVLPKTYRVYLEMLPTLTAEQKAQILAWLTEAREHAMDAGSSEEKHGWFGKYKGRINNYLSKAGYDMKQAEHDMFARKNATTEPAK